MLFQPQLACAVVPKTTGVVVTSEDLRTHGVLRFSTDENIWVAEIDWTDI